MLIWTVRNLQLKQKHEKKPEIIKVTKSNLIVWIQTQQKSGINLRLGTLFPEAAAVHGSETRNQVDIVRRLLSNFSSSSSFNPPPPM